MRANVNRLSLINVELFYVISIWNSEISLQGKLSSELIKYCKNDLGVDLKADEVGHLCGEINTIELGNLKVTLT